MVSCPKCHEGFLLGYACGLESLSPITLKCLHCKGTGQITEQQMDWITKGNEIRDCRRKREIDTVKASKYLGIKRIELSLIEDGRQNPDGILEKIQKIS